MLRPMVGIEGRGAGGALAHGIFAQLPASVIVRDGGGHELAREDLAAEATEIREFCEGYAESSAPGDAFRARWAPATRLRRRTAAVPLRAERPRALRRRVRASSISSTPIAAARARS